VDIVWVGVAFIVGIIVSKAKIPPLVGYLIAGLLLSFTGYEGGDLLHQISHLGVIFLLFTVGLHINLRNILRYEVLGVGLTHLFISTLIFTPFASGSAWNRKLRSLLASHLDSPAPSLLPKHWMCAMKWVLTTAGLPSVF
jgi:predicted Kef-type K+ transport protein